MTNKAWHDKWQLPASAVRGIRPVDRAGRLPGTRGTVPAKTKEVTLFLLAGIATQADINFAGLAGATLQELSLPALIAFNPSQPKTVNSAGSSMASMGSRYLTPGHAVIKLAPASQTQFQEMKRALRTIGIEPECFWPAAGYSRFCHGNFD